MFINCTLVYIYYKQQIVILSIYVQKTRVLLSTSTICLMLFMYSPRNINDNALLQQMINRNFEKFE